MSKSFTYWSVLSLCIVAVFSYVQFNDFIFSRVLLPAQNVLSAPIVVQPGAEFDQTLEHTDMAVTTNLQSWFFWTIMGIIVLCLCYAVIRALSRSRMLWIKNLHPGSSHHDLDELFLGELQSEKKLLEKAKRVRQLTEVEEVILQNTRAKIKVLKKHLS